jgi:hypothetical protein
MESVYHMVPTQYSQTMKTSTFSLSDVVRKVHGHMRCGEVTFVSKEDKVTLRESIIGPSEDLDLQLGGFALDLIGWYGAYDLLQRPPNWHKTIPGQWSFQPTRP